jgi:hypothetical protein
VPDGGEAWRYRTVVVCRLQRIERSTETLNELLEAFGKIVGVETVFVRQSFDSISAASKKKRESGATRNLLKLVHLFVFVRVEFLEMLVQDTKAKQLDADGLKQLILVEFGILMEEVFRHHEDLSDAPILESLNQGVDQGPIVRFQRPREYGYGEVLRSGLMGRSVTRSDDYSPGTIEDPEGVRNPLFELSDAEQANVPDD